MKREILIGRLISITGLPTGVTIRDGSGLFIINPSPVSWVPDELPDTYEGANNQAWSKCNNSGKAVDPRNNNKRGRR